MRGDVESTVKVWDIAVRLFHWALVVAFALSAWSAFQDKFGIYADMHIFSGVAVLILVVWRLLWGIVGSDTARFSRFVKGPAAIRAYLKDGDVRAHPGHNPLGALSVVAMLLLLLVQAVMGLFATDGMFFDGPLTRKAGEMAGDITRWHRIIGFMLLGLAALHILAALYYALVRKAGLVGAMITGKRRGPAVAPRLRSPFLALALLVPVAGGVWYAVFG